MPKLLSISQTARELSVSPDTVRRLIRAKQIPAVRVARRVMVPSNEIERVAREGAGTYIGRKQGSQ